MVRFKELRVTPDGKHLVIEVAVIDATYYTDVYLDKIYVDTQKTFNIAGPSATPLFTEAIEEGTKSIRLVYDIDSISDNLFFVYVYTSGLPDESTPCGMKENPVIGVCYMFSLLYNRFMKLIKEFDGCAAPSGFILDYLKLKAFQICLKAGNYTKAIELWNKFFADTKGTAAVHKCGCHG